MCVDLEGDWTAEFGVALKCGMKLTYEQYEGVRFAMSHEFDDFTPKQKRRTTPTGTLRFIPQIVYKICPHSGIPFPSLPTKHVVRAWVNNEMQRRGLTWDLKGAKIRPAAVLDDCLKRQPWRDGHGVAHVQILADGIRIFRNAMMTNVGLRVLEGGDAYNSMEALRLV